MEPADSSTWVINSSNHTVIPSGTIYKIGMDETTLAILVALHVKPTGPESCVLLEQSKAKALALQLSC